LPTISIVIRTYNEEKWIRHCLISVFSQDFKDIDVVIVDNNSTDKTLDIVKEFPIKKIINIEKYLPGLALNMGSKILCFSFCSLHSMRKRLAYKFIKTN
jgi:glycosyltransferase involved in cell wall biosynthesis